VNSETNHLSNCQEFETLLQELLDRRQSIWDDSRLIQHAEACQECSNLWLEYQQLFEPFAVGPDNNLAIKPIPCTKCSPAQLVRQWGHSKMIWSLAPTFAALLIVAVSMYADRAPHRSSELFSASFISLSNRMHTVADNSYSLELIGRNHESESGVASTVPEQDTIDDLNSLFPANSFFSGMRGYSHVLYEFAYPKPSLRGASFVPSEVMDSVRDPLQAIHRAVPYSGEFTFIPQFRFFWGLAADWFTRAASAFSEEAEHDLGLRPQFRSPLRVLI
jgi:hypothetical protein